MARKRSKNSVFSGIVCAAPDCGLDAIIATPLGPCCNKHYIRVRTYQAFYAPVRTLSRFVKCAECKVSFDRGYAIPQKRAQRPQYCSASCKSTCDTRLAEARVSDRFWQRVEKKGPEECWPWKGRLHKAGYGAFDWHNRPNIASRIAYELHYGESPGKMFVCHSCDNPPCCNPAHLWLGTAKENMQDCSKKGRASKGGLKGECHGSAKLKETDVLKIRASTSARCDLASQYQVTGAAIYTIRHRKTWRHV